MITPEVLQHWQGGLIGLLFLLTSFTIGVRFLAIASRADESGGE